MAPLGAGTVTAVLKGHVGLHEQVPVAAARSRGASECNGAHAT